MSHAEQPTAAPRSQPQQAPPKAPGIVRRGAAAWGGRVTGFAGRSFRFAGKAVGLIAVAQIGWYYYEKNDVDKFFGVVANDDGSPKKTKKKVLVLPFDSLKIVEHRKSSDLDPQRILERNKQPTITMEAKELVDIIQKAADDKNISALYADFGEGMRYPVGYAHIEDIRNAVRIFNESHRVHRNPNVGHNPVFALPRNGDPKPSYAFGYSFHWSEYFLASAFSHVHLQSRGSLDLFGATVNNLFLRSALDKYGVKAHVFKHGDYKSGCIIYHCVQNSSVMHFVLMLNIVFFSFHSGTERVHGKGIFKTSPGNSQINDCLTQQYNPHMHQKLSCIEL